MIRVSILALLVTSPAWAAEPIAIASGEHDGYTRLVLTLEPSEDWALDLGNRSAEFVIASPEIAFDTSKIFDRIAKDRLFSTNVNPAENSSTLRLNLACACDVKAYGYLDEYVIIDIFDAGVVADDPQEIPVANTAQRRPPQLWNDAQNQFDASAPTAISSIAPVAPEYFGTAREDAFSERLPIVGLKLTDEYELHPSTPDSDHEMMSEETSDQSHQDVDEQIAEIAMEDPLHEMPASDHSGSTDTHTAISDDELAETVALARTQLLHQLTIAAEQGLLDFNGPLQVGTPDPEPDEIAAEQVEEPHPPAAAHPVDDRQLRVQSVYNRDAGVEELRELLSAQDTCPEDGILDIESWGTGTDFSAEIATARSAMLLEFDEPDIRAVTELVRTYIRYGFGVEAASYLSDYELIPDHDLLLDLALVVDGKSATSTGPLAAYAMCGGVFGIWAAVGAYPDVQAPIADIPSMIQAFEEMSVDIRRMIGPKLAMSLLARGHEKDASIISDILERAPGDHGVSHTLSAADISLEKGDVSGAETAYAELVGDNTDVSVDALIRLANLSLTEGRHMSEEVLIDLGAAADAARGSEKGAELRRYEAFWLAEISGEKAALELLQSEIGRDAQNSEKLEQAAREILLGMSLHSSPESYVQTIDTFSYFVPNGVSGHDLRTKIGQELLIAGLPNVALDILQIEADTSNEEGKIVAAKAHLTMYQPEKALTLLAGVETDSARLLRVEANLGLGRFEQALENLETMDSRNLAMVNPAWFPGNWNQKIAENAAAADILDNFVSMSSTSRIAQAPIDREPETLRDIQETLAQGSSAINELAAILDGQ